MVSFEFTEIRAAGMFCFVNVSQADGSLREHVSLIFKKLSVVEKFLSKYFLGNFILQTLKKVLGPLQ